MLLSIPVELGGYGSRCFATRRAVAQSLSQVCSSHLIPSGTSVVLHGSFATGEITAFSDVDIVVLSARLSSTDLRRQCHSLVMHLQTEMWRVDPSMHHGVTLFGAEALAHYDESALPLAALKCGFLVSGDATVRIDPCSQADTQAKANVKLRAQLEYARERSGVLATRSPYGLKGLMSVAMLIPSLWYQATSGISMYKRDALARFSNEHPELDPSRAIELCTALRQRWRSGDSNRRVHAVAVRLLRGIGDGLWANRLYSLFPPVDGKIHYEVGRRVRAMVRSMEDNVSR